MVCHVCVFKLGAIICVYQTDDILGNEILITGTTCVNITINHLSQSGQNTGKFYFIKITLI